MAPLIRIAGVCLLALSSLHSTQADKAGAAEAQKHEDLVLAINLARAGNLNTALVQVKENKDLVQEAMQAIINDVQTPTCAPLIGEDDLPVALKGLVLTYKDANAGVPNYKELVQEVLTKGIQELETEGGDVKRGWNDFWSKFPETANLGYLMWSASVAVGCAVSVGCENDKYLILCRFNPTASGSVDAFDQKVYDALKARRTPLTQLTKDDLQGPGSGATMGIPSLLLAGFVAALAMVTV
ncbi:hypothetical protein ACSSS7_003482 [Eimeria intestinalis]